MKHQSGYGIVEFMIAAAIGIAFMASLLQIYSNNQSQYKAESNLSRLQENGRFMQYLLTRDLRMAGYQGCSNINNLAPNNLVKNPAGNANMSAETAIYGYEGNGSSWTPALPSWLTQNIASGTSIKIGTDVIVITKLSATTQSLNANMTNENDNIILKGSLNPIVGEIFLITDCTNADIFRASGGTSGQTIVHGSSDNTTSELSSAYFTDAYVGRLEVFAYYIKNTGRVNQSNQPIFALYQQDISGSEIEIAEGIDELHAYFGIDTDDDGSANAYQRASNVHNGNNWAHVVSIRLNTLLNSVEPSTLKPAAFTFDGTSQTASDLLIRREWETIVSMRNHR